MPKDTEINPKLDLVLERKTLLKPEQIWQAWTDPEILMKWFCPKPWIVTECRLDLKPGGEFYTLMCGPDGEVMPNPGCYLEIIPNKKLVWTNLVSKGFRPASWTNLGFPFVCTIFLEQKNNETVYTGIAAHANENDRNKHEQMGFQQGWNAAFDQLVSLLSK